MGVNTKVYLVVGVRLSYDPEISKEETPYLWDTIQSFGFSVISDDLNSEYTIIGRVLSAYEDHEAAIGDISYSLDDLTQILTIVANNIRRLGFDRTDDKTDRIQTKLMLIKHSS